MRVASPLPVLERTCDDSVQVRRHDLVDVRAAGQGAALARVQQVLRLGVDGACDVVAGIAPVAVPVGPHEPIDEMVTPNTGSQMQVSAAR